MFRKLFVFITLPIVVAMNEVNIRNDVLIENIPDGKGVTAETIKDVLEKYKIELNLLRGELQNTRNENREMKNAIKDLQLELRRLQTTDHTSSRVMESNSREIIQLKSELYTQRYLNKRLSKAVSKLITNTSIPRESKVNIGRADRSLFSHDIPRGQSIRPERFQRFIMNVGEKSDEPVKVTSLSSLATDVFYARLGSKMDVPGSNQPIIYDVTVTNDSIGYNNKTGTFTCTTSGIYVFSWTTLVNAGHYIETTLLRNNVDMGLAYSGSKDYPGSGSQTIVIHLKQGDNVHVKVGSFTPGSTLYDIYTSFSGYRLQ